MDLGTSTPQASSLQQPPAGTSGATAGAAARAAADPPWGGGGAGAGAGAGGASSRRVPLAAPQRVEAPTNFLLEFQDKGLERAYQHHLRHTQQAADLCIVVINLVALLMALLQLRAPSGDASAAAVTDADGPLHENATGRVLCSLAALQSIGLLLLLLHAPAAYARWRTPIICTARLYRLAVWALHAPSRAATAAAAAAGAAVAAAPLCCVSPPLCASLATRLSLLSPAGSSALFTLVFPLPLRVHLAMQAATAGVAVMQSGALLDVLAAQPGLEVQAAEAHQRLAGYARVLELSTQKLIPGRSGPPMSVREQLWCVYAFVTITYGWLLPVVIIFVKEVHLRVGFLASMQPPVPQALQAAARSSMFSATFSAAFIAVSLIPSLWGLLQLAPAAAWRGETPRLDGFALLATLIGLEVFMRFWLLSVLSMGVNHGLRPLARWLLLQLLSAGGAEHRAGVEQGQ